MKKDPRPRRADPAPAGPRADAAPYDLPAKTARRLLAGILLLALALRLIYVYSIRGDIFSTHLIIDAKFYDGWAQDIVRGDRRDRGVYYQDPLYAFFLAGCYKIFGHDPNVVRMIQAVLDTGTVAAIYCIGSAVFTPLTGVIAAAAACLYGPMVYYAGLLDKTSLATFLIAACLAALVFARKRRSPGGHLLAGLLFGAASMARGNMLLVALGVWCGLLFEHETGASFWASARRPMAFLSGLLLVVGVVAFRNYRAAGDFVPLTANSGLNFFIGNNPYTSGNYVEPPFLHGIPEDEFADSKSAAEKALGRRLDKASDVSNFWLRRGLSFVFSHPARWSALLGKKALLLVSWFEVPETYSFYYFRDRHRVLSIPFVAFRLLLPMGVLGAVDCWRKKRAPELTLFLCLYSASILLFFITSRYRFPIVLPLILFGAWSIEAGFQRRRAGMRPANVPALLGLALLFGLACWTPSWMEESVVKPGLSTPHTILGSMLMDAGDFDQAIKELEISKGIFPNGPYVYAYMGNCYSKLGRNEDAVAAYSAAVARDPLYHEAYNNLSRLYYAEGNLPMALQSIQKALSLRPDEPLYRQNFLYLRRAAERAQGRKERMETPR